MDKESLTDSQRAYIARTKEARKFSGKDPEAIADYIGTDAATYRSFESRRTMPQKYISRFCKITRTNERWFVSNKGAMEADYVEKLETIRDEHIRYLQSVAPPKN